MTYEELEWDDSLEDYELDHFEGELRRKFDFTHKDVREVDRLIRADIRNGKTAKLLDVHDYVTRVSLYALLFRAEGLDAADLTESVLREALRETDDEDLRKELTIRIERMESIEARRWELLS